MSIMNWIGKYFRTVNVHWSEEPFPTISKFSPGPIDTVECFKCKQRYKLIDLSEGSKTGECPGCGWSSKEE